MTPAVRSLAYRFVNGIPWHQSGTPILEKVTAREAAVIGGLDYRTYKLPLYVNHNDQLLKTRSAAIYSDFSGEMVQVSTLVKDTEKYIIVDNMDIADLLDHEESGQPALSEIFDMDTAGVLDDGQVAFYCLRMGEDTVKLGIDGDDHYVMHLVIRNSYQGNGAITVGLSSTRVVCLNTDMMHLTEAESNGTLWTFPHRQNPMEWLSFRLDVERAAQSVRKEYYALLQRMVDVKWQTDEDAVTFAAEVFPDPKPSKIARRMEYAHFASEMALEAITPIADADSKRHAAGMQRAYDNRTLLVEKIREYEDKYSERSLYWGFQGGTDYISHRIERGTPADLGASLLVPTRSRYNELQDLRKVASTWVKGKN